jgi:class 3 adenylate cyclase
MNDPDARPNRVERLIEAMDKPLLVLAFVTMVFYLLDLHGLIGSRSVYLGITLVIDLFFVIDFLLKLWVFRKAYLETPWALIDVLSSLPILDVLANGVLHLRAIRFVRGLRILRILRGLRVLRALRAIPAFEQFMKETAPNEGDRGFHRALNIGVVVLTLLILITIIWYRGILDEKFLDRIYAGLHDETGKLENVTLGHLEALGGSLEQPDYPDYETRTAFIDGVERTVYFSKQELDDQANRFEFFLIVGMMFGMFFFMYIMAYHQLAISQTQLRALLNLALPRQVAERFLTDPETYEQKSRMPASIIFMDFVGFTRTCEMLAYDPDKLSMHLEAAMDRLVGELVKHDLIIDKFIGDAVMSFRGGPLVRGDLGEHAYRAVRAAVDSIKALKDLNDPYFHRIKIGGASSDDCLIGAFGTSARLTYTILGDAVNLAARLEPASFQCGTQTLFCELTHRLCADRPDLIWRNWGQVRVAGKSEPIRVFEAFDAAELNDPRFLATFHQALEAFERNEFDEARELFLLAYSQRSGGDVPSRLYVARCEKLILGGAPSGWEPVLETHK